MCGLLVFAALVARAEETTFTEEPLPPTHFDFDMERHVGVITKLLELDPNLSKVGAPKRRVSAESVQA
jgi:hypothetical protein